MKNSIALAIAAVLISVASFAQQKPQLTWDAGFETLFDNREFDTGGNRFTESMTIFGTRFSPRIGVRFDDRISAARLFSGESAGSHSLMFGADLLKDFGKADRDILREFTLCYDYSKRISRKNTFNMTAGVFSRSKTIGEYSRAFFSDSLKFYDPNHEGIMFQLIRSGAHFELLCDWLGMKGHMSRERFMILSSAEGSLGRRLQIGYAAMMYHFAGSDEVNGVVDNVLVNPYLKWKPLASWFPGAIKLKAGYLQAVQCDRKNIGTYVFPRAFELTADFRFRSFGIENNLFWGDDLMPYYCYRDAGGIMYGNNLYRGDPFYRVRTDGTAPALCDRLEAYWEPRLSTRVSLRFAALFYFNGAFEGSRQTISVKFDI